MAVRSTLLRGGTVVDGTGAPARSLDVLVEGTRIAAMESPGRLPDSFDTVVDVSGLDICPGFIDVHSHADNSPLLGEADLSKLSQGITTEVVGNCGFSLAPVSAQHQAAGQTVLRQIFPPQAEQAEDFTELFSALDEAGYVINYVPLVGHNALRAAVMGLSPTIASADELRGMQDLLGASIEAGTAGLSTGLIYRPGMFAPEAEIHQLVQSMPAHCLYASHIRSEANSLDSSVQEVIRVAEETGRPVQISHIKASGPVARGRMPELLHRLDSARARGLDIRQDVYPYAASSTALTALLPHWFQKGSTSDVLTRLESPDDIARLRRQVETDGQGWDNYLYGGRWADVLIGSSGSGTFDGRSLADISADHGLDPFETFVEVLRSERLDVGMVLFSMNEEDVEMAVAHPQSMICSDGMPRGGGGRPHPRTFGSFSRVLDHYVRDRRALTFEDAIRKMTSLPADAFNLRGRGSIAVGAEADITILDRSGVTDRATYAEPELHSVGIQHVLLRGEFALRDGAYTGSRYGARLSHPSTT